MRLTSTQLRRIIKEEVEAVRKQSLTEARLRASIRHQTRLALNESPAEVAEVYADAVSRAETFEEIIQDLGTSLEPDTLRDFVDVGRKPDAIKAFEDALAATGEFDIDPKEAWLTAWRAATVITDDYMKDFN